VIRMHLPDDLVVHKIGLVKTDRAVDRMMEILKSWFSRFRFIPYTELRLDMQTAYPKELEAHIHKMLAHKRFTPHMKVNGGTEMFANIDEFRILHYIRTFNEDNAPLMEQLNEEQYKALGQWISP
jgi:hypothetical protein